jgi:hypothetical protein
MSRNGKLCSSVSYQLAPPAGMAYTLCYARFTLCMPSSVRNQTECLIKILDEPCIINYLQDLNTQCTGFGDSKRDLIFGGRRHLVPSNLLLESAKDIFCPSEQHFDISLQIFCLIFLLIMQQLLRETTYRSRFPSNEVTY